MNCVHCQLPLPAIVAKRRNRHASCGRIARTGKPIIEHDATCVSCGELSDAVRGLDFQVRCGQCLASRPSVERELYAARVADLRAFYAEEDRKAAAQDGDIL